MAAGDTTQGRRLGGAASIDDLSEPGDHMLRENRRDLWVVLPRVGLVHLFVEEGPSPPNPHVWGFEEHEDGTISVSPSIRTDAPPLGEWHGFLKRGVLSEV